MITNDELLLIERIKAGDTSAESTLFLKYHELIFWKIKKRIKAEEEFQRDVASDIIIAILEGIRNKNFQPQKWPNLDAYVWGVTNNKITDALKDVIRERKIFVEQLPYEAMVAETHELFTLEQDELRKNLNALLDNLEPQYRELLVLRYIKELSVGEISKIVNLPPRRVSERIHYALKRLKMAKNTQDLIDW